MLEFAFENGLFYVLETVIVKVVVVGGFVIDRQQLPLILIGKFQILDYFYLPKIM